MAVVTAAMTDTNTTQALAGVALLYCSIHCNIHYHNSLVGDVYGLLARASMWRLTRGRWGVFSFKLGMLFVVLGCYSKKHEGSSLALLCSLIIITTVPLKCKSILEEYIMLRML